LKAKLYKKKRILDAPLSKELKTNSSQLTVQDLACDTCVDFFDEFEGTLLNILLNVGVGATCTDLCTQIQNAYGEAMCLIICTYVGFDAFVDLLNCDDIDPVWVCTYIDLCPMNSCLTNCTEVTKVVVTPSSGKLRTTFNINVYLTVLKQTGTGTTEANIYPPKQNGFSCGVLNTGFAPGKYVITIPVPTDWQDWTFPLGTYQVHVNSCSSDCYNQHATIFSKGAGNFTITN